MSPSVRLLLVNPHEDARFALAQLLAHAGYGVLTAASAHAALAVVVRERVDVMISEIALPGADACELMRLVKGFYPRVVGIALGTTFDEREEARCRQAGFVGHFRKPLELDSLITVIGNFRGSGS